MKIRNFAHALEIIDLARESGMLYRDPYLRTVCKITLRNAAPIFLQEYLDQNPHVSAHMKGLYYEKKEIEKIDPFLPRPEGDELNLIDGLINIAWINNAGDTVGLDPLDFTRILFMCGMPGCGKTTLNRLILDQVLEYQPQTGANIIATQDSKHDLDDFITKYPDIKVLEWSDLRFNIWEAESWDTYDAKLNAVLDTFAAANWLMQRTHVVFKHAVKEAFKNYKATGIPTNFSDIRPYIKAATEKIGMEGFKQKDTADYLLGVVQSFIDTEETLNCRCGLTIEDFWSKENVIVNLKGESNPYVKATFVMTMFKELQRYYEERPTEPKLRTLINIDECRNIFPNKGPNPEIDHNPDAPMTEWVATRRSSGIGLIAATQEILSAPNWLVDNASFIMGFPIMGESREKLARVLNLTDAQYDHIDHLAQFGQAILSDVRFPRRIKCIIPDFRL